MKYQRKKEKKLKHVETCTVEHDFMFKKMKIA